jgi:probable blue pigment (indigoidine) exporter
VRANPRGPALVSLGAAGWGAENLFRTRLDQLGLPAYPIVLFEHLLQVVFTLPWLLRNVRALARVPRRAFVWVALSGGLGSSLGTVCYTAALGAHANPIAAAMLLNLQPVVSTLAGAILFRERIARGFFLWAAVAIVAGAGIALPPLGELGGLRAAALGGAGLSLVLATILLWGFATAAGRGAMRELPVGLGAPLRLWAGLFTTALVLAARHAAGRGGLELAAFLTPEAMKNMILLTTLTGALPLFVYFAGLADTPASLAGYCEMFYTLSATLVGWAFLGGTLLPHQAVAAAVLVGAIVQLNRIQEAPPSAVQAKAA